jgi:hypothetical protein
MKPIHFAFYLLSIITIGIFSCSKGDITSSSGNEKQIAIDGFVTDEFGLYVKGALVEFGNITTTTSIDGYFQIPRTKYYGEAYIKVSKQGYFTGSRTLVLKKSTSAHVRISLMPRPNISLFNATWNSHLDFGTQIKIVFTSNSIVDFQGNPYADMVSPAVRYLDPTDFSIRNTMPGDQVGINMAGEMQQLGSFGMVELEIWSPSGIKLQFKDSTQILLRIEIPESIRSNAPSLIPLWYFDEEIGLWKEHGVATRYGNFYEGKISHFGFWNCAVSFSSKQLIGRLLDNLNYSIVNANVKLTLQRNGVPIYFRTNNDGVFEGLVPTNDILTFELMDDCKNLVYSKNIGPFTTNSELGDILIPINSSHIHSFEGSAVDCNNHELSNVLILANCGNEFYSMHANDNGKYTKSLILCKNDLVSITAFDLKTLKQSSTFLFNLPGPVLVSTLQVCSDTFTSDEFISFEASDGASKRYLLNIVHTINMGSGYGHSLSSNFDSTYNYLVLQDKPKLFTPIPILEITFRINDLFYAAIYNDKNMEGTLQYSMIANKIGEFYEGTFHAKKIFKGRFIKNELLSEDLTVNGTFRIKRKI